MEILSITTDTGAEYNYYVVCLLSSGARDYIALTPQAGNDTGIKLFRYNESGGIVQVTNIESSMELDAVICEYEKIKMNEYDDLFESDDLCTVVITLDDGAESVCDVIGLFDFNDRDYIAVMPIDRSDDSPIQIIIFEYAATYDEQGEMSVALTPIPSRRYPKVRDYYMNMISGGAG